MNTLKSFLGLSLLGTAIWLLSVLQELVGPSYLIWVLVGASFIFYGIFLKQKSKNKNFFFYAFLALGVLTIYFKFPDKDLSPATSQSNVQLIKKAALSGKNGVRIRRRSIKKENSQHLLILPRTGALLARLMKNLSLTQKTSIS